MAPRTTAGVEGLGPTTVNIAKRESSGCGDGSAFPAAAVANKNKRGEKDDSYTRLWHACAGPNVYVPRPGEKVFYFPQGHMEQVEAYANEDGKMEMPIYNLPSKILCNVVCVLLKAEVHTDEVFAQITLLPLTEQERLSLDEENNQPVPQSTSTRSFSKTLTPSDTSTHGGFSVPKRQADECLPPLDMSQQPPVQELIARDLQGFEWHFRHIFRGQPKRHLLTSGWSTFVTAKRLVAGDACIFVRGENGELRVGIRRANKKQDNASTALISGHSMQHGILASAFHANSTGTLFTVYYRPWTSPAAFIIPCDQYMKSAKNDYSIGMRFRMCFEGDECAEKRLAGTILDIEDNDCIRWPSSEWRCLKVQWDASSDTNLHPERLSPWNIMPFQPNKRAHVPDLISPGFPNLAPNGLLPIPVEHTPPRQKKVFQGQEISDPPAHEPGTQKPPLLPQFIPPSNPDWNYTQLGLENNPLHDPLFQCPGSAIAPSLTNQWPPIFNFGVLDSVAFRRSMSVPNIKSSGSQDSRAFKPRSEIEPPLVQPNSRGTTMLFGVNIVTSHPELPSPQVVTSSELFSPCSITPISQSSVSETIQISETSKSVSGVLSAKQCKNCCSVTNRSCIKVLKYGAPVGRSVDLTRFDGYGELIAELDQMFDFKGSLIDGSSGWQVTYMDDEGDMMLIGDYLWHEFQSMVQKLYICPKEEIERLNPGSPNATSL